MRRRAQQPLRGMDLQIEHGRVGEAVGERLPGRSGIGRVPDADVRADVDVVRRDAIDDEGVVLDVEEVGHGAG